MPKACASADLPSPMAGRVSARSNSPGWVGQGRGLGLAEYSFISVSSSSVILLEIHTPSVAVAELERQAPRPIHVYAVANRIESAQRVEVEARHAHLRWRRHNVQTIKADQNPPLHLLIDFHRVAG